MMKELEIIIKPEKLENLKRILDSEGRRRRYDLHNFWLRQTKRCKTGLYQR